MDPVSCQLFSLATCNLPDYSKLQYIVFEGHKRALVVRIRLQAKVDDRNGSINRLSG